MRWGYPPESRTPIGIKRRVRWWRSVLTPFFSRSSCLIRRAALRHGLAPASDPTRYTLANMTSRVLSTKKARGQQIRSLQFAIERLAANPALASLFIHKPGPLSDESPTRQVALADVYRRGFNEINQILAGVRTSPD